MKKTPAASEPYTSMLLRGGAGGLMERHHTYFKPRHLLGLFAIWSATMQSKDYVPGVSGWKIDRDGEFSLHDGGTTTVLGKAPNHITCLTSKRPAPTFVVVDGQVYIRQAEVERVTIATAKFEDQFGVRIRLLGDKYVTAGLGLGIAAVSESAARAVADSALATRISALETRVAANAALLANYQLTVAVGDCVREVIRHELRSGGLLHRS